MGVAQKGMVSMGSMYRQNTGFWFLSFSIQAIRATHGQSFED